MKIPEEVLFKLAQQAQADGLYRKAAEILKKASPSTKRNDLLGELYYDAGAVDCAIGRFSDARESLTRAMEMHPNTAKRDLAHQRLLLIARGPAGFAPNEWVTMGRACAKCDLSPSLYNCARCSRYGTPMNKPRHVHKGMLSPVIDEVYVPAAYRSGYDRSRANPFSRLLRMAKNGEAKKSCFILGHMLADYIDENTDLRAKVDVMLPVPTSDERLRLRGYSIPELMGTSIAARFCLPMFTDVLVLTRSTEETRGRSRWEKQLILTDAFAVSRPETVAGLRILVIDDIMTTGTTLEYAAMAIRRHHPTAIFAAVLAHTESTWSWEGS